MRRGQREALCSTAPFSMLSVSVCRPSLPHLAFSASVVSMSSGFRPGVMGILRCSCVHGAVGAQSSSSVAKSSAPGQYESLLLQDLTSRGGSMPALEADQCQSRRLRSAA